MVGLAVAADAPPGACATLSALEVPGSMAWTDAEVGAFAWVVRERTSYLEAPVTTYGSVPAVAVPSRPPSMTVRRCHWPPAATPPLGQVTPTTVTAPATSWTGVTAAARAEATGSGDPGADPTEPVASLAVRNAATDDATKPTRRTWLATAWG